MKKHVAKPVEDIPEDEGGPLGVWKVFVAFGIVLVLIIAFFTYSHYRTIKQQTDNRYNGFDFAQAQGGLWVTRIEIGRQPYDIPFYFHPRETEEVIVDPSVTKPIFNAPREVYISIAPDAGSQPVIAGVEISRITGSKYGIYNIETHGALSEAPSSQVDLPVINCRNSSEDTVVIQFVQAKQNVIARSEKYPNCILMNYVNASDSIRVADRYAYMLLKIAK